VEYKVLDVWFIICFISFNDLYVCWRIIIYSKKPDLHSIIFFDSFVTSFLEMTP